MEEGLKFLSRTPKLRSASDAALLVASALLLPAWAAVSVGVFVYLYPALGTPRLAASYLIALALLVSLGGDISPWIVILVAWPLFTLLLGIKRLVILEERAYPIVFIALATATSLFYTSGGIGVILYALAVYLLTREGVCVIEPGERKVSIVAAAVVAGVVLQVAWIAQYFSYDALYLADLLATAWVMAAYLLLSGLRKSMTPRVVLTAISVTVTTFVLTALSPLW